MKNGLRRFLGAGLLSVGAAAAHGQTCGEWIITDKPVHEGAEVFPVLIAPLAPDSAVAVREVALGGGSGLLRMHWDGQFWTAVGVEPLGFSAAWDVRALHANSLTDLWVAGLLQIDNFHGVPFLAHFDGQDWETHEGFLFEDPNPQAGDPIRTAEASEIVFIGPNDIWALGAGESPEKTVSCPVASHWDGSDLDESMPQIQPVFGRINYFEAGSGIATDDVWIVGDGRNVTTTFRLLTYHWDGASWTPRTSWTQLPGSNSLQDGLRDVVAVGPDDVWAVGDKLILEGGTTRSVSLYLHWDGSGWHEVAGPDIGPLTSVAAVNANDLWASCGFGEFGGRLAHWDGTSWTEVPSAPIAGATHIGLTNLAADAGGGVWTVGYWAIYDGQGGWTVFENIIEHLSPGCDGDLDADGDVDLTDLSLMLSMFGSCEGEESYNASADLDGSGCVELVDLSALLASFGG